MQNTNCPHFERKHYAKNMCSACSTRPPVPPAPGNALIPPSHCTQRAAATTATWLSTTGKDLLTPRAKPRVGVELVRYFHWEIGRVNRVDGEMGISLALRRSRHLITLMFLLS
jgi:hypothetical protein